MHIFQESSSSFLPWMLLKWTYTASFAMWNYYNAKAYLNTRSKIQICGLILPLFLISKEISHKNKHKSNCNTKYSYRTFSVIGIYYCVAMLKMYLMLRSNENMIANEQTDEVTEEVSDEETDDEVDVNLYSAILENEPLRYEISYEDNTIWYNEFQIN